MSDLLWPGDRRAGALLGDAALVDAMTRVEIAWLRALQRVGLAAEAATDAIGSVTAADLSDDTDADGVEAGGNPVIPLVQALRARAPEGTARWLHRGLTSQDVLDTALMLCVRDALDQVLADVHRQAGALRTLVVEHRSTVQAGRTLTQHAVPTTFGLTAASWLSGVLDAAEELVALRAALPVQLGGAGGTLAATVALTGDRSRALSVVNAVASELGLRSATPWMVNRRPVTRVGDALVAATDAWGRIANDVLLRSRPEIGELAESAPGGSSTMPHKRNPVLSVLLRRAAIAAPFAAAQLHAAAAAAVDERPDGGWHAEWAAVRSLGRMAVVAGSQAADLLEGLEVDTDRLRATAEAARDDLLAEARAMGAEPANLTDYLGITDDLIDRALERAEAFDKDST
jgi:3-carboxy-cis,cis-muconate cycloisomerase